jgi:SpoVK/Ycf46/Vps4 family AAA+-type ATPase
MKFEFLFAGSGVKLPKGALIYGSPGSGKTYLSKAVVNELGVSTLSVKGPELLDKYIGGSEQKVRDLFEKAA